MLEELMEIIKAHSNDAELGRKVREWYWKQIEQQRVESWYKR